jgi:hypothetical protein
VNEWSIRIWKGAVAPYSERPTQYSTGRKMCLQADRLISPEEFGPWHSERYIYIYIYIYICFKMSLTNSASPNHTRFCCNCSGRNSFPATYADCVGYHSNAELHKNLSGHQPCQFVERNKHFRNHICTHHQDLINGSRNVGFYRSTDMACDPTGFY